MPRMNPPVWGGGTWDGVAPGVGVADVDVDEGDVDVDDGVDDGYERVGVDMLRDPLLPKERLPPMRANASTVINRRTTAEMQTVVTTNDRLFMVPPGSRLPTR